MSTSADEYISFLIKASGSPFTSSLEIQQILLTNGYKELKENQYWTLEPQQKYFLVRDNTSVVAFRTNKATETSRMIIAGSHLDSPYLMVKPHGKSVSQEIALIHCECYGGAIWNTWLDRDLGICGRAIMKDGTIKIFSIKEPLLRIPSLAIHLDTDRKYCVNKETHLPAMCAEASSKKVDALELLYEKIATKLEVERNEIISADIILCDIQPASYLANKQFIVSQGQDNLQGAYTSLMGFIQSEEMNNEKEQIDVYVCFDNEEIGSVSRRGADGMFVPKLIDRIHSSLFKNADSQSIYIMKSKSVVLSIDGAHANHPNIDVMEKNHPIRLNGGVVMKNSARLSYMNDALLRSYISKAVNDVPIQIYVLKQDMLGGSTIGPHISAFSGLVVIDFGCPMLSMHSIREMTGTKDVEYSIQLVKGCYLNFPELI